MTRPYVDSPLRRGMGGFVYSFPHSLTALGRNHWAQWNCNGRNLLRPYCFMDATMARMLSSSGMVASQPIHALTLETSGTRRGMSSKPAS